MQAEGSEAIGRASSEHATKYILQAVDRLFGCASLFCLFLTNGIYFSWVTLSSLCYLFNYFYFVVNTVSSILSTFLYSCTTSACAHQSFISNFASARWWQRSNFYSFILGTTDVLLGLWLLMLSSLDCGIIRLFATLLTVEVVMFRVCRVIGFEAYILSVRRHSVNPVCGGLHSTLCFMPSQFFSVYEHAFFK